MSSDTTPPLLCSPVDLSLLRTALGPGWDAVEALGALAVELQLTPWLVGGGVRDLLQGRLVRDADVVVEGDAATLARTAAERLGGTAFVHSTFGTAKWTPPGWSAHDEPIDIATARTEHYPTPASLPVVAPSDLARDLHRRDFTINSMAVCLHSARLGEVLDPFDGRQDLHSGTLRVLHPRSFRDDPTRAIRAARFAARFGLTLSDDTRTQLDDAIKADAFAELSTDRLGAELDRLLREPNPVAALQCLEAWRLLPVLHPQWTLEDAILQRVAQVVDLCRAPPKSLPLPVPPLRLQADGAWVALASGLPSARRPKAATLIPGTKDRRARFVAGPDPVEAALQRLSLAMRPSAVAHALAPLDPVQLMLALAWLPSAPAPDAASSHLHWWLDSGRHIRSTVDGRWLRQQGHAPGPGFRDALQAALDVARDGGSEADQQAAALARLVD